MNKISKKLVMQILVIIEILIFIVFLYNDILFKNNYNSYSLYLKYSTIILCLIIVILIGEEGYNKIDTVLVLFAKLFTAMADYYLLFTANYKLGILCFCVVQITYIIRHSLMEKETYKNIVFMATALTLAIIASVVVKIDNFDKELLSLGCLYAALLTTSVYCGLSTLKRGYYPRGGALVISIGIILFLFCDLNVAFFNIVRYIGLGKYEFFTGFLIWFFYFPSQLLLSLSGYKMQFLKNLFQYV